ncbi:MAG: glycosyltransferase family 2 protein [Gemmatimonadales bacterium]|nr:glycosyltransferase family 2 protein [Gemmatimonadales bacterium]MDQ3427772.1 glycosyltransferase family 2 protein [Gemmatimonadota bacterium]
MVERPDQPASADPDLSVVAPLYNESDNVLPLVEWILQALDGYPGKFEVILVDDGSRDGTWARIASAAADPRVRGLRLGRNVGQTAAMMAGFDHSRGRVIVSLDGDLQNDPRDIPALLAKLDDGYDLVCGWRQQRQDKFLLRKVPSWVANRLIRRLTGVQITDNGCSLKAYRRDLLDRISLYAEQHRFIPALSATVGARITEMPVRHHARRFGESKYGISRTVKVLVDLITLKMITTFRSRPLAGYGLAALPPLVTAALFGAMWLIATQFASEKANALVFPGAALLFLGVAFYLVMLGLVAEVALSGERENANDIPTAWEVR